jgi:hypothetical protein
MPKTNIDSRFRSHRERHIPCTQIPGQCFQAQWVYLRSVRTGAGYIFSVLFQSRQKTGYPRGTGTVGTEKTFNGKFSALHKGISFAEFYG